jgi:cyclic beta-1,2-glucan synthetase
VLLWLENQLAMQGTTGDEMVHTEHQRQGASNVTVRNIITSMRLISDVNWPDFFEDVSLIDQEFRSAQNLACDFESMDFATRNLYRSAIEELARGSTRSELDIARAAIDVARAADGASLRVITCLPEDDVRSSGPSVIEHLGVME